MWKVYFEGRTDALLCMCGNELRVAETLETTEDLHVFEMCVYRTQCLEVQTERIGTTIFVTKKTTAEAVRLVRQSLRVTAACSMCRTPNTYQLSFDGSKIVDLSPVT